MELLTPKNFCNMENGHDKYWQKQTWTFWVEKPRLKGPRDKVRIKISLQPNFIKYTRNCTKSEISQEKKIQQVSGLQRYYKYI